jgi:hypothetical protein
MALLPRLTAAGFAAALSLALSGCGGFDGVELNGKVFDAMGISTASLQNSKKEPRLAERAPLVLPPNTQRLPEPGADESGAPDVSTQLNDPERKRMAALQERERLHKQYCTGELTWKERATGKAGYGAADVLKSPYGACGAFGDGLNNLQKN